MLAHVYRDLGLAAVAITTSVPDRDAATVALKDRHSANFRTAHVTPTASMACCGGMFNGTVRVIILVLPIIHLVRSNARSILRPAGSPDINSACLRC